MTDYKINEYKKFKKSPPHNENGPPSPHPLGPTSSQINWETVASTGGLLRRVK